MNYCTVCIYILALRAFSVNCIVQLWVYTLRVMYEAEFKKKYIVLGVYFGSCLTFRHNPCEFQGFTGFIEALYNQHKIFLALFFGLGLWRSLYTDSTCVLLV